MCGGGNEVFGGAQGWGRGLVLGGGCRLTSGGQSTMHPFWFMLKNQFKKQFCNPEEFQSDRHNFFLPFSDQL